MNEEMTARLPYCVLDHTRRWSLLAMGWAGYQQHGSGAVVIAGDSPKAYFAPAHALPKLLDQETTLDDARQYCAIYDPQKTIVLVCIGPQNQGAVVAMVSDSALGKRLPAPVGALSG